MRSTNLLAQETEQHTILTFSELMCMLNRLVSIALVGALSVIVKTDGLFAALKILQQQLHHHFPPSNSQFHRCTSEVQTILAGWVCSTLYFGVPAVMIMASRLSELVMIGI